LGTKSLFHLAKASARWLKEAGVAKQAVLLAATGMGGSMLNDLSREAPALFPDHGGIAGLMKTLALEWPEIRVRVVDLNLDADAELLAQHLADEMCSGDLHAEVGFDGRRRITLQPVHTPVNTDQKGSLQLDSSSVVLITG